MVGLVGLEPTTPALSRQCSNQLSYRPKFFSLRNYHPRGSPSIRRQLIFCNIFASQSLATTTSTTDKCGHSNLIAVSRKEVIQPHLPIRLPCYDFTPVTNPAVVIALLAVRLTTSGRTRSHGVTGGVYKARERIHAVVADTALLAIPASCRRVAACNPYWGTLFAISVVSRLSGALYVPL